MERTPLRNAVPCFDDLWNKVKEFVKENQGKKGYIDTQSDDHDNIYTFVYFDDAFQTYEIKVHGVRVNPANDDLEIIYDSDVNGLSARIEYGEDDFEKSVAVSPDCHRYKFNDISDDYLQ